MGRKIPGWARTILIGAGVGTLVLGVGGRLAMQLFAELTTGSSRYTPGGTATVVWLGTASGALGGLILAVARALFWRWPPVTSLVYWVLLVLLTLRGLNPVDGLRLAVFFPLIVGYGIALQWATWSLRAHQRVGFARDP